jgi:hypothetical protein
MLKKTITYTDYEGVERTETFFFNLSQAEVIEMQMSTLGGYEKLRQKIIETNSTPELVIIFKELILKAYGEKSPDGRRFIKSEELSKAFSQTEAYSDLFIELSTVTSAASSFINGIMPAKLVEAAAKAAATKQ